MDKIRKAIIKWLLGADWEEYWELHTKYIYEMECNKRLLEETKESIEDIQILREKLLKEIDDEIRTSKMALKVLDVNEKLERICKENGIDINKLN